MSLFTAQLRASRHVTCLRLPQKRLLEKEEHYTSDLERQAGILPPLPLEQMCRLFYLNRANVEFATVFGYEVQHLSSQFRDMIADSVAAFRQGSKPPICPSFWQLGPRF